MLYRVREFAYRSRQRGHGRVATVLWHLPLAILARAWRALARRCNNRLLTPGPNRWRLARFQRNRALADAPFYVIVMPGTLHYLMPCLQLLPASQAVTLIYNGAAAWERRLLRDSFPQHDEVTLWTLPGSSVGHGEVISLLLWTCPGDFGLLDHDLYVFDASVFERLEFQPGECLLACFGDYSEAAARHYPHTWFLYLRRESLLSLMRKYRVDARIYHRVPRRLRPALEAAGLGGGQRLKAYLGFFDTLHLLLILAWYEGMEVSYLESDMRHLGGTSGGSLATRDLRQLYVSLRLLEHAAHPVLTRRYLAAHAPFKRAAELLPRLGRSQASLDFIVDLEALLQRLPPAQA